MTSNNILLLPSKGTIGNRLILPKVVRIVSFWSLFGLGYFRNVIPHLILKLRQEVEQEFLNIMLFGGLELILKQTGELFDADSRSLVLS